ncbi:hypothetical protein E4T80_12125 [Muribacter muris]|uniref:Uncharacterized protein n=1 Tax=Muribacter muris TaxID=67855 RepID=A0A4Y9JQH7_9PAST|nr:hypothetical protein [Muribacter muris]MBF0786210.1 hypothetical protein [Muribacter muris]MBF0826457.1 hypothetical protein [Muribacter muris]TFV07572.1 hypothetical protein E4T80_12125 [Muribacter muris]
MGRKQLNQRWRKLKKRRVNLYFLENRVSQLEGQREVVCLDLENTHDLLQQLEIKVNRLIEQHRALAAEQQQANTRSVWQRILQILNTKGNP